MGITMRAITVKLPDDLRLRLQAEADRRGVSLGRVVREAAETYVVARAACQPLSLYERSKDLCGCLRSGIPDLGSNPKHMEGYGLDNPGSDRHRSARRVSRRRPRRS